MAEKSHNPRAVALDLLRGVLEKRQSLDLLLSQNQNLARLESRDRAFARLLVTTLLRRLGQIDALIDACLDRPLKARFTEVRHLLRLGTAQLIFLKTPPHAAVSTTLALANDPRSAGHKGLLNAVLRRLSREGEALAHAQKSAKLNTPDWLWQSWNDTYGLIGSDSIAQAHLAEPPLDITVKTDPAGWAEKLGGRALFGHTVRIDKPEGDIARLPGFAEGAWWVQDAAATLPLRLLGGIRGQSIVDLCAAPGGKTAQLVAGAAQVTAIERSPARVKRLEENLTRLKMEAKIATADALVWRPAAPADGVLLDAPCSATGTLRRHPDIAHLKGPPDIVKLARLQDGLLDAALEMLRPGGRLVYATCSLQPEEGRERIAALLARDSRVKRLPLEPEDVYGHADFISEEGDLRTLPSHLPDQGGLDGFFACRLQKF